MQYLQITGTEDAAGDGAPVGDPSATMAAATTVEALLLVTSGTLIGTHLWWLVDQCHRCRLSPRRMLLEDQARLLIDALYQRGEYDLVARALEEPWAGEFGDSRDEVTAYVEQLGRLTEGQPEYSPYAALASSAARVLLAEQVAAG